MNMKVILLQRVDKLGEKGDEVEVRPGYFRHWLLPKKLAVLSDAPEAKEILKEKLKATKAQEEVTVKIKEQAAKLQGKILNFKVRADAKGKLYGSVGPREVAKKLVIKPEQVLGGPFDKLGDYQVRIKLSPEEVVEVKVIVV